MDRKEVLNQLKGLRKYCSSMVPFEETPGDGWEKDRDALDVAIEVLANLEADKEKIGGKSTMSKTKVTVATDDGFTKELEADTAIVFTINIADDRKEGGDGSVHGEILNVGAEIPKPIRAEIIGRLVAQLIEKYPDCSEMEKSYYLFALSQILNEKCEELMDDIRKDSKVPRMASAFDFAAATAREAFDALADIDLRRCQRTKREV